jgi:hypothetical protein
MARPMPLVAPVRKTVVIATLEVWSQQICAASGAGETKKSGGKERSSFEENLSPQHEQRVAGVSRR